VPDNSGNVARVKLERIANRNSSPKSFLAVVTSPKSSDAPYGVDWILVAALVFGGALRTVCFKILFLFLLS
jgi:hypothetical protein